MDFSSFFNNDIFTWVVLPSLIFIARIFDVSIGTIRIIFISRGMKHLASLAGFFEVLIWLIAIGQIIKNLTNIACYITYAGGFATGTYVGMYIENKLSVGVVLIRIITKMEADKLVEFFKTADYGVTSINAHGIEGPVKVIYAVIERHDLQDVVKIIKKFNPKAFYSVEDIRYVSAKIFPLEKTKKKKNYLRLSRFGRKGK
jgi:uncharacterized protein YebE (UPF0316 family)